MCRSEPRVAMCCPVEYFKKASHECFAAWSRSIAAQRLWKLRRGAIAHVAKPPTHHTNGVHPRVGLRRSP